MDAKLARRCVDYVCTLAQMDAGQHYDPKLHKLARDLHDAGVRCPPGYGGWRKVLGDLSRDQRNPVTNPEAENGKRS